MSEFSHIPVMLEECMEGLEPKDGGIYFDGTLGGAGHSYEILRRSSPTGKLIATDLDDEAIAAAKERLAPFEGRFSLHKSNFKNFEEVLSKEGVEELDGVMLDFGVSSHQIDEPERGFSYMSKDAPLDMRMDGMAQLTAEYVVNEYPQSELARILKEYGEEKFASQIAANVVKARQQARIKTCGEFVKIIEDSIPKKFQQNGPAARKSFQAVRIEVNGELDGLYETVLGLTRRLKRGGRIAILTFHSLEDRIVKNAFRFLETDCICPKELPVCVCGKKKEIEILTKKPVMAGPREAMLNTRSRSAKLRIAQKV
ncbi:MAG TPA: 16S rRNA (cytosine(1402)-N(4))-methyltransferase RsmH [Candidatus Coproplasma excrementigallinarum]|uniref:Ribosomal RNA small subunit methyltransferase H n=1 Tax=Candidatus Coproplasma excrementigallinarum TaxID=2840747 RepID=A0A9D1SIT2_9FIRM|nr:16S rRNA (cytosine(1402)-N(4))-methyltransferase RsmH [Candidatus Coproplasma excrementigallinarum]